jgi:hypothetical protein
MATTDAEVIVPDDEIIELTTGLRLRLQALKSRQFLKLLKIVTHGAGGMLFNVNISASDTPEEFGAKLLAVIGYAIPDAENEVIDFLMSMAEPAELKKGRKLSSAEKEENKQILEQFLEEMDNPTMEDLVTLVEAIVMREASDLQALGKRLMGMFKMAQKLGQVPEELTQKTTQTDSEE